MVSNIYTTMNIRILLFNKGKKETGMMIVVFSIGVNKNFKQFVKSEVHG